MTMPGERYNALIGARDFLVSLLDPKQTPRVPKYIRREAYYQLKHYPSELYLRDLPKKIPKYYKDEK